MAFDEDARLAKEVKKGSKDAFAELVEKYQRPIFSFIYNFFREYSICEDITQETFLRAYRFIKTYDAKQKFSTWLFAIAKNLCIDEKRKRDKAPTVPVDSISELKVDYPDRGRANPEEVVMKLDTAETVKSLVSGLPEKYRTAIILFYFNELSYEEISEIMGLTMANTKIILFRAKKMMSEMYRARMNK
ncbi:MAG: sigma-70 family RNA polymerase sigma factor [Deltaproteobacteria bacterium]|nr:sigma-70 family RNA polymerase sigma factor [Deltaproteobacteria bacterium]